MASRKGIFSALLLITFIALLSVYEVQGNRSFLPTFDGQEKVAQVWMAKTISFEFVHRLLDKMSQNPLAPLLPPADDPAIIEPMNIPIDITITDPCINIQGDFTITAASNVTGLSAITDDFSSDYPPSGLLSIDWEFGLPNVTINGEQKLNIDIDLGTYHSIIASGLLFGNVQNVFLNMNTKIRAPFAVQKMSMLNLSLDIGFSNLNLNLGEAAVDDSEIEIDWERQSENIQNLFNSFWTDEARPLLTEMIRCSIDHVINDCFAGDLIGSKFECLKFEINELCFGEPSTTSSPGSTTSTTVSSSSSTTNKPGDACGFTERPNGTTANPGGSSTTTANPGGSSITTANPGGSSTNTANPGDGSSSPVTESNGPETTTSGALQALVYVPLAILTLNLLAIM